MQKVWKRNIANALLGGALVLALAGCASNNTPDTSLPPGTVENAVNETRETAKDVGVAVAITPKVKSALLANTSLKGSSIDVSSVDKTVTLTGTVTNNAQKNLAGNIAKQQAAGYQIVNNLQVKGGVSPVMNKKPAN
jgi:hypothetical protein